ncbi:hypothetical protein ABK040_008575 [Willaertia magna]
MPSHGKKHGKLYVRASEREGRKRSDLSSETKAIQTLPFYHCALTFQPITGDAVITPDGYMFDILSIVPFVKNNKINPITGKPLELKDLISVHISKDEEGKPICPITHKVFNDQSHIIAIKTSGNVYSYDAIQKLNFKQGNVMKDLLDNTPFTKEDIITIQDPQHVKDISSFQHVVLKEKENQKKRKNEEDDNEDNDESNNSLVNRANEYINLNSSTTKVLEEIEKRQKKRKPLEGNNEQEEQDYYSSKGARGKEEHFGVKSSDSKASALTSTIMGAQTKSFSIEKQTQTYWKEKLNQYERIRKEFKGKKAFVSLHTNLGDLNFELYPWICPQTCDNFIGLCLRGYYDNVIFHRLIKGFMIQGGDPTGTGMGGESLWEKDFKDEIYGKLKHDSIGVLSMANRGPNTNSSQFFITFGPCSHLDLKHTIFGKLCGGLNVLKEMEKVKTDKNDRPLKDVIIQSTTVYYNPFAEDEQNQKDKKESEEIVNFNNEESITAGLNNNTTTSFDQTTTKKINQPVGKYLNLKPTTDIDSLLQSFTTSSSTTTTTSTATTTIGLNNKNKSSGQKQQAFNFDKWLIKLSSIDENVDKVTYGTTTNSVVGNNNSSTNNYLTNNNNNCNNNNNGGRRDRERENFTRGSTFISASGTILNNNNNTTSSSLRRNQPTTAPSSYHREISNLNKKKIIYELIPIGPIKEDRFVISRSYEDEEEKEKDTIFEIAFLVNQMVYYVSNEYAKQQTKEVIEELEEFEKECWLTEIRANETKLKQKIGLIPTFAEQQTQQSTKRVGFVSTNNNSTFKSTSKINSDSSLVNNKITRSAKIAAKKELLESLDKAIDLNWDPILCEMKRPQTKTFSYTIPIMMGKSVNTPASAGNPISKRISEINNLLTETIKKERRKRNYLLNEEEE